MARRLIIDVLTDCGYWLVFSVLIALAQLWLLPLLWYIDHNTAADWHKLLNDGGLLLFAMCISSVTAGDYFRKAKQRGGLATFLCISATLLIVILSVFSYGHIVGADASKANDPIFQQRLATMSMALAFLGVVFNFAFTIIVRFP